MSAADAGVDPLSSAWFQILVEVPVQRVFDLLDCAGSDYWARLEHSYGTLTLGGKRVYSAWSDNERYEQDGLRLFTLDSASLQRGARIFAKEAPRHFALWLEESEDADSGDIFLQCCLFGKVVFS